ncbi:putative quercetin 2,3-dioxygenase [Amphibalanus amphitrite]|uniref:Putative quercetin 2,3-dioxygenase n=1 Tax=Amphibalanus amphitrite TaxID=1232801 RepID=A0A6A4VJZ7_AMPAM|nr:putative quercetin 2,3-dioxygenase [Amphibalanus amphitrite]
MPTRVIHKTLDECLAPRQTMEHGLFLTRKIIGSQQLSACDPFILADHVGPIRYGAGEALGVPDHPHRGLVVVTYVVEGGMRHQDSLGHNGELLAGSVQWLTTGRGLVHRELPNDSLLANGGTWEGFQLWVNLPAKDKMMCPEMQEVRPEDVPEYIDEQHRFAVKVLVGQYKELRSPIRTHTPVTLLDVRVSAGGRAVNHAALQDKMMCPEMQEVRPEDVPEYIDEQHRFAVKVLVGQYKELRSPIRTHTPVTLLDVRVSAGGAFSLELAAGHTCWLYVWRGAGQLGHAEQRPVTAGHVARLSDEGHAFRAEADRDQEMRLLIGSGVPLKESVFKFGTFVMSSVSEIEQALEDYRSGRLGQITVGGGPAQAAGSAALPGAARGLDLLNPFQGEIEQLAVAEGEAPAPGPAALSDPATAHLTNGHRH